MTSRGRTEKVLTHRYARGALHRRPDQLIVEEPLVIRLDGVTVTTTMRTPGNDFELACGFCFTEGLLGEARVIACRYCGTGSAVESEFNIVDVDTGGAAPKPEPRLTPTTSSCGVCGSATVNDLRERLHLLPQTEPFPLEVLAAAPERVLGDQALFDATGAVHAAALLDREGSVLVVREDIGRHNAVDKVVGSLLLDDALPATGCALFVSGRASFEIVQKAWAAGIGAVVAVSAPSSLAVDAARLSGLTLCGFARDGHMNVYVGLSEAPG